MQFLISSFRGYFERVDSWGNARWTTAKAKAWRGEFADAQAEVWARGLRGVEIVAA